MKKLVFILFILVFSASVFSQKKIQSRVISAATPVADTINIGLSNYTGPWIIGIISSSLDAADCQIKIQGGNNREDWYDYGATSTLTLAATGNTGYSDDVLVFIYLRVIIIPGSVTSGTVKIDLFTLNQ
jgi:hypothetical protein